VLVGIGRTHVNCKNLFAIDGTDTKSLGDRFYAMAQKGLTSLSGVVHGWPAWPAKIKLSNLEPLPPDLE
jgi:hypothetical protein